MVAELRKAPGPLKTTFATPDLQQEKYAQAGKKIAVTKADHLSLVWTPRGGGSKPTWPVSCPLAFIDAPALTHTETQINVMYIKCNLAKLVVYNHQNYRHLCV